MYSESTVIYKQATPEITIFFHFFIMKQQLYTLIDLHEL